MILVNAFPIYVQLFSINNMVKHSITHTSADVGRENCNPVIAWCITYRETIRRKKKAENVSDKQFVEHVSN